MYRERIPIGLSEEARKSYLHMAHFYTDLARLSVLPSCGIMHEGIGGQTRVYLHSNRYLKSDEEL